VILKGGTAAYLSGGLMLVSLESFQKTALNIAACDNVSAIAIDFETTGLNPYRGDKAFLLGVCIDGVCFSVRLGQDHAAETEALKLFLCNERIRYLAHNAKFEMAFLKQQFGVSIHGHIWDTEVMARLQYNNHRSYSLQACAERIGHSKYQPMVSWVKANQHKYHEAPDDIIIPYVEQDARLSWLLYKDQCDTFRAWQTGSSVHISGLVALEMRTTRNLFEMEAAGLPVNVDYCREADAYEQDRATKAAEEFKKLTGVEFTDSAKCLRSIFDSNGIPYGKTEKGNPSFNEDALKRSKANPIVAAILMHRDALKRSSTYWQNFIAFEVGGIIYPNIRQAGTASGRFSAFEPNVQNWPDDAESPTLYPIRRAFVAGDGWTLISMDYAQMELRLMADEANEEQMIRDIVEGIDMHQRVADVAGTPRGVAKNARFAKLYGAGPQRIALTLGVPLEVAQKVCEAINSDSPRIDAYSGTLIQYAKRSPFGYNWMGRRYFFDRGFEYKYPNYRIQGGCSEILRIAMDESRTILREHGVENPQLLIPIHDELVFRARERDMKLIPTLRQAMIDAAKPMRRLKMDVSVHVGQNMHDMEKWDG
jgi:DNA polymerase-1